MKTLRVLLFGLLLSAVAGVAMAEESSLPSLPPSGMSSTDGLSKEQEAHYRELIHQLRCLVCQNQTIADSDAPLAQDLRDQVRRQLLDGRDDAQIKEYLTSRYGDFVLYKPPMKRSTFLLWVGPFLLLVLALVLALRFMRRARPGAVPAEKPDPAVLKRLLDEES